MVSEKLYTLNKKEKEKLSTVPFDGETNTIIVIVSLQLLLSLHVHCILCLIVADN